MSKIKILNKLGDPNLLEDLNEVVEKHIDLIMKKEEMTINDLRFYFFPPLVQITLKIAKALACGVSKSQVNIISKDNKNKDFDQKKFILNIVETFYKTAKLVIEKIENFNKESKK